MKKCKLGKHGCYEDGNCYFIKFCTNQVEEETAQDYEADQDSYEEVDY